MQMGRLFGQIVVTFFVFLVAGCDLLTNRSDTITVHTRELEAADDDAYTRVDSSSNWVTDKTAFIICDMWDAHWCQGAANRVSEMAPRLNEVVKAARKRGVFVIHAPSSVVDFYKDEPGRKLAKGATFWKTPAPLSTEDRWGTKWCYPQKDREPDMPIDDKDMGCDCETKCQLPTGDGPWTRQIDSIDIAPGDAITDNGQETWNLLEEREIDNVVLMGVHLNMCVLGRPFGIRQMVNLGKNVFLMRDMTDTMYNSEKRPFVSHFAGTDLVVEHVERHWCPTILSTDIVGGKPFHFAADKRDNK
jgi:nicotinamidase-related amidase